MYAGPLEDCFWAACGRMWPTGHQLNTANAHLQTVDHFWQTTIDFTFTCMSVVTVKRLSGKAKQGTKMMHFFVRIAAQWLTWPELVWIALITHHGSSDSSSNITLQTSQINHIQSGFIFFEGTLYKTVKCVDAQTFGEGDERTLDIHSYRQESLCSFFLKILNIYEENEFRGVRLGWAPVSTLGWRDSFMTSMSLSHWRTELTRLRS